MGYKERKLKALREVVRARAAKNPVRALAICSSAIRRFSREPRFRLHKAQLLLEQRNGPFAAETYIENLPPWQIRGSMLCTLGIAKYRLGKLSQANKYFRHALMDNSSTALAQTYLAFALMRSGNGEQAISMLSKTIKSAAALRAPLADLVVLMTGKSLILLAQGRAAEAQASALNAVRIWNAYPPALALLRSFQPFSDLDTTLIDLKVNGTFVDDSGLALGPLPFSGRYVVAANSLAEALNYLRAVQTFVSRTSLKVHGFRQTPLRGRARHRGMVWVLAAEPAVQTFLDAVDNGEQELERLSRELFEVQGSCRAASPDYSRSE